MSPAMVSCAPDWTLTVPLELSTMEKATVREGPIEAVALLRIVTMAVPPSVPQVVLLLAEKEEPEPSTMRVAGLGPVLTPTSKYPVAERCEPELIVKVLPPGIPK